MAATGRKLRIGLIFGGRSAEHEVSLASAVAVMAHLDSDKYEIIPIGITKAGSWLPGVAPSELTALEQCVRDGHKQEQYSVTKLNDSHSPRHLVFVPSEKRLATDEVLDVAFPVLHGTYGEDGTLQGLLEIADVPYVGCGVLGSVLGMDKEKMKMIFRSVGLLVIDSLTYWRQSWERSPKVIMDTVEQRLGYPCFVKPVNLGSSIGVSKAHNCSELEQAIDLAAEYDSKIIIEHAINCREFACSVLGNYEPMASVVGEVIVNNEFYDYQAKYLDSRSSTVVPAEIPQTLSDKIRCQAIQAFLALDLCGLARMDFFLENETGQIYINEVNTLPSFTPQCMYPRLCEVSGLPYSLLLERLIELAIERHADRRRNRTTL